MRVHPIALSPNSIQRRNAGVSPILTLHEELPTQHANASPDPDAPNPLAHPSRRTTGTASRPAPPARNRPRPQTTSSRCKGFSHPITPRPPPPCVRQPQPPQAASRQPLSRQRQAPATAQRRPPGAARNIRAGGVRADYPGGNETLWAMHQLDIMRKHRRLLETKIMCRAYDVHRHSARPHRLSRQIRDWRQW